MALSDAGYRAIAPDLRGYGETEVASSVKSEYSMKHITADLLALLDALSISSAVFIGHDWYLFFLFLLFLSLSLLLSPVFCLSPSLSLLSKNVAS